MQETNFNETLYYIDDLYRFAYYLTHNSTDAEDLVQETYLTAYSNWDLFEPGTNSKAWIFKVLYNNHINRLKKKGKEPKLVTSEKLDSIPAEITTNPSDLKKIVDQLVGDEFKEVFKKMPAEYVETLILAWIGNLSYAEISDILDCPVGTVMSRIARARAILKENLRQYWKEKYHI